MRVVTVESTTLAAVGYDEARRVLQLEFCSRAGYLYFDVPAAVYQALLDASSKGKYFNGSVRGRYPYCQMPDWDTVAWDTEIAARCDR